MFKKPIVRGLVAASSLSLALTLGACSGADDEAATPPPATETSASTEASAPESGSPESGSPESGSPQASESDESTAPQGEQTEIEIGQTWTDPDTEDVIKVVSVIRNFDSEEFAEDIADGGEVVLVQVEVTPGQVFGGAVSAGDFEISWDNGDDFWNNKTRMVEEELAAADYEVFDRIPRRDGGTATGWIAFVADEKADTYLLNYERGEAKVIGEDETIPAFKEELEIPAA